MDSDAHKYWLLALLALVIVGFSLAATKVADRLAKVAKRHQRSYLPLTINGSATPAPVVHEGGELLGTKPTAWVVSDWLNSPPLTLESLRGKVVLVRWWTGPECPFCEKSAPALNEFWQSDREKGLMVVGMYHHKADKPLTREHVETLTKKFGFEFPVAIDTDWKTLHRWWLDTAPRRMLGGGMQQRQWTSVTFVLDREGVIRHIHPGGTLAKGEPGYDEFMKAVEQALAR